MKMSSENNNRLPVVKQVILKERTFEENELIRLYKLENGTTTCYNKEIEHEQYIFVNPLKKFCAQLKSIFLPVGYPSSVPNEYLEFQKWNLLQDFCSYLRGIMSTQAILVGMGVGRSDVTAVAATIQWVLRDGASLLGGLVFTSLSSYNFGQDVKAWRLFADLANDLGITLDMLAPLCGKSFLLVLCAASVCKSLCGVAAGATVSAWP
jgi:hypothetical protein